MRTMLGLFSLLITMPLLAADRPNLIVILSDDMGYSDIGCYGSEIQTPNLDALAAGGVRWTQFYNTARCCPTRACLLTGLYPHQAGVGHMMEDRNLPGYTGNLNQHCRTIAEVLHPAGYRNYAVGKWHVTPGKSEAALQQRHNWPLNRGFDRFYGTIHGAGSYWDPSALVRDMQPITSANDPEYQPDVYYYTDAIGDHARRFLREHATDHGNEPFFLYVAFTAAHWPMHAHAADIQRYAGRYDAGYDAVRRARWEKQQQLGVIDPKWPISPTVGKWSSVVDLEFETRCMEVYAAMIDRMDQAIGQMVAELESLGQLENTVIMFMQDNGGCAEAVGRDKQQTPDVAVKFEPMSKDAPQYDSQPSQTRDGRAVRKGYGVLPGPDDTYIAYGRAWANVSNVPFREYKHWVHEGGISTPLIVHWPAGIAENTRNSLFHEPCHLIDIMATCVDLARANYPREVNGQAITPLPGVSLRPAFTAKSVERPQPIFWEHEGNRAVRSGQWKLVAKGPVGEWQLYDMATDRAEMHDLAQQHPERVKELSEQWMAWARQANVLPWPWKR
ncbi:MAG: arylsulfatase [Planctomycetales bacterium]|nr:arylsulfatase [Planctomycetales bacterium]